MTVHLRNGRAESRPHTKGAGVTWCGKKLVGSPIRDAEGVVTYSSYGAEVSATLDLSAGDCAICRERFDAAYNAAFPEGPEPIATFRLDDPEDMRRARELLSPEALSRHFSVNGRGIDGILDAVQVPA